MQQTLQTTHARAEILTRVELDGVQRSLGFLVVARLWHESIHRQGYDVEVVVKQP